jgi:hypothetical protein
MVRRVFWMSLGAFGAIGGSRFVKKKVEQVQTKLAPSSVANQAVQRVKRRGNNVKAAVGEGRRVAATRELELKKRLR